MDEWTVCAARPRSGADVLTIGLGTTVAMWAVGYVGRMPPAIAPSWLLLLLMLLCVGFGGVIAGRYTVRGWRGGAYAAVLSAALNLLILGSLLGGETPNHVVPSALWWIPGSILVCAALGTVGGFLGSRSPSVRAARINWTCAYAAVACGATFLLVLAGGLVTSKEAGLAVVDWPNSFGYNMFLYPLSRMTGGIYYEHVHRLFGSLVGLATVLLVIHVQRTERRRWLRRFAWVALAVVVLQGVLGGLRVTGRFTLSTLPEDTSPTIVLAIVHGVVGQVFFGMVVAIMVFTSTGWQSGTARSRRPSAATDRALSVLLVVLLIVQLVFGAVLRHVAGGLHIHITMAVVVLLVAVSCGARAWGLNVDQPVLQRIGRALVLLSGVQLALGLSALMAVGATADAEARPAVDVILTTAHQGIGAILLAGAVMLALWTHRLLIVPVWIECADSA